MNSDNSNELLPIVDPDGRQTGTATRGECHSGVGKPLHPVVHLHLFDPQGRLYLQRRPEWKDIQPGKWDTAVAREELGIEGFVPEPMTRYVFESDRERELVNTFRTVWDAPVAPSDETAGGRFWPLDEIRASLGKGVFTPNFEQEFARLFG